MAVAKYRHVLDFKEAREKAFNDACVVWNNVDKSQKQRIKLTGQTSDVQLFPVIHSKATSHMHIDLDGDSNEDEEAMFGELE